MIRRGRPDGGGSKYLRNVSQFLSDYTAQRRGRQFIFIIAEKWKLNNLFIHTNFFVLSELMLITLLRKFVNGEINSASSAKDVSYEAI
jgi:hypothetical protein